MSEEYLTLENIATLLHVTVRTIKKHLRLGEFSKFPFYKINNQWVMKRKDFDRWLETKEVKIK